MKTFLLRLMASHSEVRELVFQQLRNNILLSLEEPRKMQKFGFKFVFFS